MYDTVIAHTSIQKVIPRTQAVTVALLAMRPRGWSVMVAWLLPGDRPPEVHAGPTGFAEATTARRPLLPCSLRSRPAGPQLNNIILIIGVDLTRSTEALKLNQW